VPPFKVYKTIVLKIVSCATVAFREGSEEAEVRKGGLTRSYRKPVTNSLPHFQSFLVRTALPPGAIVFPRLNHGDALTFSQIAGTGHEPESSNGKINWCPAGSLGARSERMRKVASDKEPFFQHW